ncbi:MFS transporter [Rhodococcus sp. 02-925g]|uniref:MFS transporter n=1 Tax=Rhodococcus sp. 02-925g TaxID=2022503 RepID=UPI000B9A701C|nr:MFS transporter [Rhodococcus sp. 02-925g]OZE63487.1 MFS transporter [Rhodococcus sp. 02-925g]
MATTASAASRPDRTDAPPGIVRTAFASFIGTMIEWYDFFIFGTAAALIFNEVFFSNMSAAGGTLASFATFGVAFVARPVGAVLFGHYGDRLGRKKMLVLSLLLMGGGTVVVGVLPTYETWGMAAPILLVISRLVQGLAVGGEWGGAILMAVESAPPKKRAFYGSWPQMGVPAALVLSTLSFYAVRQLPEEQFLRWGWRIPFLASTLLIGVGLYIRLAILESPEFSKMKKNDEAAEFPIVEVVKKNWRGLLVGIGVTAAPNIPFYLATVFVIKYAQDYAGMTSNFMLLALCVAGFVETLGIPLAAMLADRLGVVKVLMAGAVFMLVLSFPFFWLIDTGNSVLVFLALFLMLAVGHTMTYAPMATFMADLFPTNVRYTGTSVCYHLGGALTSGPVPLVAAALVAWAGSALPLSIYLAIASAVTIVALCFARSAMPGQGELSKSNRPAFVATVR